MLTCKQVSRTLEKHNYEDLSPYRRFMVRFHIALCIVCGRYNHQVIEMHKLTRCFRDHADEAETTGDLHLSEERKLAIQAALHDDPGPESR